MEENKRVSSYTTSFSSAVSPQLYCLYFTEADIKYLTKVISEPRIESIEDKAIHLNVGIYLIRWFATLLGVK